MATRGFSIIRTLYSLLDVIRPLYNHVHTASTKVLDLLSRTNIIDSTITVEYGRVVAMKNLLAICLKNKCTYHRYNTLTILVNPDLFGLDIPLLPVPLPPDDLSKRIDRFFNMLSSARKQLGGEDLKITLSTSVIIPRDFKTVMFLNSENDKLFLSLADKNLLDFVVKSDDTIYSIMISPNNIALINIPGNIDFSRIAKLVKKSVAYLDFFIRQVDVALDYINRDIERYKNIALLLFG